MGPDFVSAEVSQFIRTHFQSFEQLEVLLILHEEPNRQWTVAELSERLRSSVSAVRKRLNDLVVGGFLVRIDGPRTTFHYCPDESEKERRVEEIRQIYQGYRSRIIGLIFSGGTEV